MTDVDARFWAKVVRGAPGACWPWTGGRNPKGYGRYRTPRSHYAKVEQAHRYAYELLVGPVPSGMHLDHLCRNRACVNPAHLEPVTNRENVLRGDTLPALNLTKTHCPYGHPYSGDNLGFRSDGSRSCKECGRERYRRDVARKLAAGSGR